MHDLISGAAESRASDAGRQLLTAGDGLLELLPIGVYICDAEGIIVRYNRKAAEFWGRAPVPGDRHERFCGSYRLYLPDGSPLPHPQTPMADALRRGRAHRDREVWIERPDGSRIVALVNIDPLFDDDGRLVGAVNCFQDISARKRAEERMKESERRLSDLVEAIPGAIYTTDAEGRITMFNQAAATMWGVEPAIGDSTWCGSWRLLWPDGGPMPHDECPMAIALKECRPIRGAEAIAERPDGTRVPFLAFPTPMVDETGTLTGAINMLVDISELWSARRALHASEEFNRKVLESSRDCIKVLDLDGRLITINACGLEYLGLGESSGVLGADYLAMWNGSDRGSAQRAVRRARSGKVGRFTACYRRPGGAETWWDEVVSPILGPDGRPERLLVISRDVTERKRAEEQRQRLIDELNHRVKNMLATVQSIAGLTFRETDAPAELVSSFEARLHALSRAHDHLSNSGWRAADFRSVLSDVLLPYDNSAERRIRLRGTSVRLPARATVTLAMVLQELATNAAKYGALSVTGGQVSVAWRIGDNGSGKVFRLSWRESNGPQVRRPARTGFGSRLIERGVAYELNGSTQLDYAPSGLRCRLMIPLAALDG